MRGEARRAREKLHVFPAAALHRRLFLYLYKLCKLGCAPELLARRAPEQLHANKPAKFTEIFPLTAHTHTISSCSPWPQLNLLPVVAHAWSVWKYDVFDGSWAVRGLRASPSVDRRDCKEGAFSMGLTSRTNCAPSMRVFVWACAAAFALCAGIREEREVNDGGTVAKYTPLDISAPVGASGESAKMRVMIPTKPGAKAIASPSEIFDHVSHAWDVVVETNQAGLTDAKAVSMSAQPLTPGEAWHHYQAGLRGIVDSARFLIAFTAVPAVQTGGSAIHLAAARNDVPGIERALLDEGGWVDEEKMGDGNSALILAASLGHVEAVEALIREGANVEHAGRSGATALMVASAFGHTRVIEALIDMGGAMVDAPHPFAGNTALHFAAEMGREEAIKVLCTRGASGESKKKTGGTPLHTAADCNQTSAVQILLSSCGCKTTSLLNGDTVPLYLAAQRGFSGVISALAEAGADLDFVMPRGRFRGEVMAVGGSGQKPMYKPRNTEIGNGATALHAAVENGHLEATRTLLDLGARQLTSMEGASPLLIALQYRHPKIALELLRTREGRSRAETLKFARADAKTPRDGMFPLFVAAMYGYNDVVERLVNLGANLSAKTKPGHSVLEAARDPRIARLLAAAVAAQSKPTPRRRGEL